MSPELRNFVECEQRKILRRKTPKMTINDIIKDHNHEINRTCLDCGDVFDLRKEIHHDRCPKCDSKNIK